MSRIVHRVQARRLYEALYGIKIMIMSSGVLAGTKFGPYRCILLVMACASFSGSAWPQTQLATISGTITDSSGAVVPGANVSIVNQGTELKRSTLTDTAGQYRFSGLPTRNYSLRVEKSGF